MAFKKGETGNPGGRPKEKAFTDALRLELLRESKDKRKKLNVIAEKLVECAMNGESWAIQQVADRLDGKPAQEATVTIDDKRDAADWSREELVAFLSNARADSARAAEAKGRGRKLN
jgi:hypothetical protein